MAIDETCTECIRLRRERDEAIAVEREPVHSLDLLRAGGPWLAVARGWMQREFRNGSHVTWGSSDVLEGNVSPRAVEGLAAEVAAAAMRPQPRETSVENALRARWKAEMERDAVRSALAKMQAERDSLRAAVRDATNALGNGSFVAPEATSEFHVMCVRELLAQAHAWKSERDEARSQRAAILAEAREAEMQLRVGINRAKMAAYRARRAAEETEALVSPIDEACAHRIRAMLDGPELLTEGKRILAERDAARAERDSLRAEVERWRHGAAIEGDYVCPDSLALDDERRESTLLRVERDRALKERDETRAEVALVIRQRDVARIALEDLANGRAEVQCLVGAPHEPGRHCQVHKGGTGECDACLAARRVERTTAVGTRLAQAVVDMRSAVVALSGGNVPESLGVRINAANEVLRDWHVRDGEVG